MHKAKALKYLSDLCDSLEDSYDADYANDNLVIQHTSGQFLLNYHGTMDQIWLSSPLSGAHHFIYKNGQWLCTRTSNTIDAILKEDLNA